ncbi:MAG: ECF transporter S component [Candidatus Fimivicinus sp.]|nr:ECF transporter S component [Oscillospiraceae bacterium]MDY5590684.1 ECF transporter S component [Candidatus Fimivicinus sp.]
MRARRAGVAIGGGCLAAAPLMVILWKRDSFLPALLLAVCGVLLLLFFSFEHSRAGAQKIVLIALLSAVSCAGRVLFAGIPSVQPSSFLIILTGLAFGPQAGFMTGAMTALTSNMLLGQGPWTVWQMAAWGLMGLLSGLLYRSLKKHPIALSVYGFLWGFLFGWMMNLWTVSGGFFGPVSLRAVIAAGTASLPLDLAHAVCNLLLLLLLAGPFLRKLERIAVKYGLRRQVE